MFEPALIMLLVLSVNSFLMEAGGYRDFPQGNSPVSTAGGKTFLNTIVFHINSVKINHFVTFIQLKNFNNFHKSFLCFQLFFHFYCKMMFVLIVSKKKVNLYQEGDKAEISCEPLLIQVDPLIFVPINFVNTHSY